MKKYITIIIMLIMLKVYAVNYNDDTYCMSYNQSSDISLFNQYSVIFTTSCSSNPEDGNFILLPNNGGNNFTIKI